MSHFADMLENSRLVSLVEKIEGGTVSQQDVDDFVLLQQVDIVRAGQLAAANMLRRQEADDAKHEQILNDIINQYFPAAET